MKKNNKKTNKGFEAWFYRTFPGPRKLKKMFLIFLIIIMFAYSFVLLSLANGTLADTKRDNSFATRIQNTRLK